MDTKNAHILFAVHTENFQRDTLPFEPETLSQPSYPNVIIVKKHVSYILRVEYEHIVKNHY